MAFVQCTTIKPTKLRKRAYALTGRSACLETDPPADVTGNRLVPGRDDEEGPITKRMDLSAHGVVVNPSLPI